MADEEEVVVPAEEEPEAPETPEEEVPEGDEPEGDEPKPDAEEQKHKKAFEDQKRRAEKAEARVKELEGKGKKETDRAPTKDDQVTALEERTARAEDRAIRAELAAAGHKHPDDVKYILDAAKRLGVEPLEAASDELVAGKLKRMGEVRATKEATPGQSGRSGSQSTNDVGKLADKVAGGGELPKDPKLAEKVQKELARRSQAGA